MKALRIGAGAALCALLAGACESDLTLVLEGLQCSPGDPPCLRGYECNRALNICVSDGSGNGNGGSGAAGTPAAGGSASGGDGSGAGSGASSGGSDGGDTSNGGGESGGSGSGGSGSQGGAFGGPDAAVSDAGGDGCVPVTLYQDNDGDHVGRTDVTTFDCPGDGWATVPGDCRDDIASVHPGQGTFFGTGYADVGKPDGISFDYDCANGEQVDTTNTPPSGPPNCQEILDLLSCSGTGYQATTRSGFGISALCGSDIVITCSAVNLVCTPTPANVANAFRCK